MGGETEKQTGKKAEGQTGGETGRQTSAGAGRQMRKKRMETVARKGEEAGRETGE